MGFPSDEKISFSDADITRFQSLINKTNNCWIWGGPQDPKKYGTFTFFNKGKWITRKAHRCSFIMNKGDIPKGLIICHTCDNPSCVNPEHLFSGTYKDNAQDRELKGRGATSKLTLDQVNEIRSSCNIISLSKKYNISPYTILDMMTNKSWVR